MDAGLLILLFLFGIYVLFRLLSIAAENSAKEEFRRKFIEEFHRKKKIDELYGRDIDEGR